MDQQRPSKTIREQQILEVRAKAPIAANFEDCVQGFNRLCAALDVNPPTESSQNHEKLIAEDSYSRLRAWGDDSGASASSKGLDYALRGNSSLRAATINLLADLNRLLEDASGEITAVVVSTDPLQDDEENDSEAQIYAGTSETQLSEASLQQSLAEIVEVIGCLARLLPALQDPAPLTPQATASSDRSLRDAKQDIGLAVRLFPRAPIWLNERLGRASWRRRLTIQNSQQRVERTMAPVVSLQKTPEIYFSSRQRLTNYKKHGSSAFRNLPSRHTSETGMSSIIETVFSKTMSFGGQSEMSVGESEESHLPRQIVPKPPFALVSGSSFPCPYCHQNIVVGEHLTTNDEWIQHVYTDLEPYICTFKDCVRSERTFGVKEDWFEHELGSHRILKIWYCGTCRKEFSSRKLFERHVETSHKEIFNSGQLSLITSISEKYSQTPLPIQLCSLCGATCENATTLKLHLGDHLEQLALASFLAGTSDEDEILEDDDPEESQERQELLRDFVAEQSGLYIQAKAKETQQTLGLIQRNFELLQPSTTEPTKLSEQSQNSGASESTNNSVSEKKGRKVFWGDKVTHFLDGQVSAREVEFEKEAPTLHTATPSRSLVFVGRHTELQAIHVELSSSARICVVSGVGGVGKTTTAVEYCYRYEKNYSYIFWIDAETAAGCAESYGCIAAKFTLGGSTVQDQDGLRVLSREFLQLSDKPWLLVFDNVETWLNIQPYIPSKLRETQGAVLITTGQPSLTRYNPGQTTSFSVPLPSHEPITLSGLTVEEGGQLLLCSLEPDLSPENTASHPKYELATEASILVERLPLAISMIAGYVHVSRCTLADFLEIWKQKESRSKKSSLDEGRPQDWAIDALWSIGIRELSVDARELLTILAFLDPVSISEDLLVGEHEENSLEFLHSEEPIRYKRMTDELIGRRLITIRVQAEKQSLNIHRLLQKKVLNGLPISKCKEVFSQALLLVRKRYPPSSPKQIPDPRRWQECIEYDPHVQSLQRVFLARNSVIDPTLELATLFYDAGFHAWERQSSVYEGSKFLEVAESILDKIKYDPYGRLRADIHSMMGLFCDTIGISKRAEGLERQRKAIDIRRREMEKNPGDEESDVLLHNAATDLGLSLLQVNDFKEAAKLFEICHKKYREWGTEDEIPFEYSKYYDNTGMIRMYEGRFDEAVSLIRRGAELIEKEAGKDWRYWRDQYVIACCLLQAGDLNSALALHLEILAARSRLCGKYDEATLQSYYTVGSMYDHRGDLEGAAEHIAECLLRAETAVWHQEALGRAQFHLSVIYKKLNIRLDEAARLEKAGRMVLEKYPDVPSYLTNVSDELSLFDDMQPTDNGRFTGRLLLGYVRQFNRAERN